MQTPQSALLLAMRGWDAWRSDGDPHESSTQSCQQWHPQQMCLALASGRPATSMTGLSRRPGQVRLQRNGVHLRQPDHVLHVRSLQCGTRATLQQGLKIAPLCDESPCHEDQALSCTRRGSRMPCYRLRLRRHIVRYGSCIPQSSAQLPSFANKGLDQPEETQDGHVRVRT
jgi:hypothetical protein